MDIKPASIAKIILFFDTMLTPKFITLFYWLALVGIAFASYGVMQMGGGWQGGVTFGSFCSGLGFFAGCAIGARVVFEILIVIFKINDNIAKIAGK